jgi:hypothetical protein
MKERFNELSSLQNARIEIFPNQKNNVISEIALI